MMIMIAKFITLNIISFAFEGHLMKPLRISDNDDEHLSHVSDSNLQTRTFGGNRLISEVESLSGRAENLEASNIELTAELNACRSRETENMKFNSGLMSENSELKANNDVMSKDVSIMVINVVIIVVVVVAVHLF